MYGSQSNEPVLSYELKQAPCSARNDESIHLQGIANLQNGHIGEAVRCLEQAVEQNGNIPQYHCNLAVALRRQGALERAAASCRRALALRPKYPEALFNYGCVLYDLKQFSEALEKFNACLAIAPSAAVLTARGDALRELRRLSQARTAYRKALALDPDHAPTHINLAPLLLQLGELDQALEHSQKAVGLEPGNGTALMNLGYCLAALERFDEAMEAYADALEQMPQSAQLCCNIAQVWLEVADLPQAEQWFRRALDQVQDYVDARIGLAAVWDECGARDEAAGELRSVLESHPDSYTGWLALGKVLWNMGDADGALEAYRKSAELAPQLAGPYVAMGQVLASAGALQEAESCYRRALALNPFCIPALNGLATGLRGKLPAADVKRMESLLSAANLREGARASLHNGLAHYYDGVKGYAAAGDHAVEANRLYWIHKQQRGWEYDPADYEHQVDRIIATFDQDFFARTQAYGDETETPVFIVGMPRSGTTLTEQILASHPRVFGAGERDFASRGLALLPAMMGQFEADPLDYLPEITPAAVRHCAAWHLQQLEHVAGKAGGEPSLRIIDKMPDNYVLLGWIVTLFPRARIIHCRRDPRDVALSCWLTQFSAIRWASNQEHIGERLRQYYRLMKHWRRVLPSPVLELDYEALVANQEGESRRLVEWLGLEWYPSCLSFYHNERLVRTASVTQVRRPIYRNSVARWHAYERHLAPLIEKLQMAEII